MRRWFVIVVFLFLSQALPTDGEPPKFMLQTSPDSGLDGPVESELCFDIESLLEKFPLKELPKQDMVIEHVNFTLHDFEDDIKNVIALIYLVRDPELLATRFIKVIAETVLITRLKCHTTAFNRIVLQTVLKHVNQQMDEADGAFFKVIKDLMVKGDYPSSNLTDITSMANSIVSGVHDELFGKIINNLQSEEYRDLEKTLRKMQGQFLRLFQYQSDPEVLHSMLQNLFTSQIINNRAIDCIHPNVLWISYQQQLDAWFKRFGTGEVYLANYAKDTDWTTTDQSAMHGVVAAIAAYLASMNHSYEVVKETMSSRTFKTFFEWIDKGLLNQDELLMFKVLLEKMGWASDTNDRNPGDNAADAFSKQLIEITTDIFRFLEDLESWENLPAEEFRQNVLTRWSKWVQIWKEMKKSLGIPQLIPISNATRLIL